jgi:hypothetical protein
MPSEQSRWVLWNCTRGIILETPPRGSTDAHRHNTIRFTWSAPDLPIRRATRPGTMPVSDILRPPARMPPADRWRRPRDHPGRRPAVVVAPHRRTAAPPRRPPSEPRPAPPRLAATPRRPTTIHRPRRRTHPRARHRAVAAAGRPASAAPPRRSGPGCSGARRSPGRGGRAAARRGRHARGRRSPARWPRSRGTGAATRVEKTWGPALTAAG